VEFSSEYRPIDSKNFPKTVHKQDGGVTNSENTETKKTQQQPRKTNAVSENLMEIKENQSPISPLQSNITLKAHDGIQYKMGPEDENWIKATICGRAGKTTGNDRNWYNMQDLDSKEEKSLDLGKLPWKRIEDHNHDNDECVHSASYENASCDNVELAKQNELGSKPSTHTPSSK
jgi:hypothetical protein